MAKHSIQISNELYSEIFEYCKINGLKIGQFINDLLAKQFIIEKYGDTPFTKYETTILNNKSDSSLTTEIIIHEPIKKDEIEVILKNDIPFTVNETVPLVTNGGTEINEKYKNTKVPSEFYGEINDGSETETKKPKKRRL